jgi:uncharacterized protein RhaS with RHS repeats
VRSVIIHGATFCRIGRLLGVGSLIFGRGDSIGFKDDINLYAYVGSDPVDKTDPTGTEAGPAYAAENLLEDAAEAPVTTPEESSAGLERLESFALDSTPIIGEYGAISDFADHPSLSGAVRAVPAVVDLGGAAKKIASRVEKTASGRRVGDFTRAESREQRAESREQRAERNAAKAENATKNGGKMVCTDCGKELKSEKSEKGVSTPDNQAQVHHDPAIKDGGGRDSEAVVLCPECHQERHNAGE